jgi:hypothetical protein
MTAVVAPKQTLSTIIIAINNTSYSPLIGVIDCQNDTLAYQGILTH